MHNDDWVGKEVGNAADDKKKTNSLISKSPAKFSCSKFVFVKIVERFIENLLAFIEI